MKNYPLSIYCPTKEIREQIRKELKRLAGNKDQSIWEILIKLLKQGESL